MSDKVYMIRKVAPGGYLYSVGGRGGVFGDLKRGKRWRTLNHVKLHLAQLDRVPPNWEVVEFELVLKAQMLASEVIAEVRRRKQEKAAAEKRRDEEAMKTERRKQYEALKQEFEPDATPGKWREI